MSLTDSQLANYRSQRARGVSAFYAYRFATTAIAGERAYPWLTGPLDCPPTTLEGEIGDGYTAEITVEYDDEAQLGDDDVTGWFTDDEIPGVTIKNACKNAGWGFGDGRNYYHPSNYDLTELAKDGSTKGMSKSVAADYIRERIAAAMREDHNRTYYRVSAEVSYAGVTVGRSALHGIDMGDGPDTYDYLADVAADVISQAREEGEAKVATLRIPTPVEADLVYFPVNEDGMPYGRCSNMRDALDVIARFPEDIVIVARKGSSYDEKLTAERRGGSQ